MKKQLVLTALLTAASALPAHAQSQSALDQIRAELKELNDRVNKVESENQALKQENAELKDKNDRMEATTDYLKSNTAAERKQMAQDAVTIEKAAALVKNADWANRISFKGDFRYRHENIDAEGAAAEQTRQRIRARFGMTAKVNDTVTATVQLATNAGNGDPRSYNQTLGDEWSRKGVGLDLAYVDWKAMDGLNVQVGKMPQPWQKVGSYFWDGDLTPEGGAVKYNSGMFFVNAFSMWLSERSAASDATLSGGQLGLKTGIGRGTFTGAVGYYDVGAVQNKVVSAISPTTCTANPAFFGGATNGNLTVDDNGATAGGCNRLLNDFNMIEALAQFDITLGKLPLSFFGNYIQNQEADEEDTGYSAGVTLGKASDPRTWEVGYLYQDMEKDAQFGQFVDSDFGSGTTGSKGSTFKFGYAFAKNWTFNGTYFMNKRRTGNAIAAPELDYDRYQLDLNYKF